MKDSRSGTSAKCKFRVLLLDDSDIDNFIHGKNFQYQGNYQCRVFRSPYDALEHLRRTHIRYDYLVLDIYMSPMNGFTFFEHFKRLGLDSKHGIVIILTASLNPLDRIEASNLGLKFMEKPFRIEDLFN
jgi:DNA-binding response OmpR family regulator